MLPEPLPDDGLRPDLHLGDRAIRVRVGTDDAELVADRMWGWGVRAVGEIDLPDGRVELITSVGSDPAAVARAVADLDPGWECSVDESPTVAADDWKHFATPIWYLDDRVVVPAWRAGEPADRPAHLVTRIDPGSAFGLGDHPTTRSCLAVTTHLVENHAVRIRSVLDVGCGAGAIAVVAAQLGVPEVRAIDVADAAVQATRVNALRNEVADRIEVDTAPLATIEGSFDLVVANILAPVLVALADDLRRVVAPGGVLVISGILEHRHDHVLRALAPLEPVETVLDEGWATVTLRHVPGPAPDESASTPVEN